ncbi:LysR family transcriptional regulator [Paenibacillus roseipurpureus]|uniref:LysR family transcriptional regulator n=1 Tax=Paenibacillus roseopurpureus TaxID=2918901 RepID=A0AA96LR80_9BACL|nr:LysR family transcriptional regulator [Paenibacillus sp. MBLB1832]WNR44353.1 LysR family transcriptional regulator [Paenibacillus sp. MBLB1832]
MNIIQFQYFVEAAESGSFTETAKKNSVTVPAISQSISQLEQELGATLFTRSKKGIVLTPDGVKAMKYARTILTNVRNMRNELGYTAGINTGNIVIATIPGMVSLVTKTTIAFMRIYPHLNVQLLEEDNTAVMNQVMKGEANMGFVSLARDNLDEAFTWEPVIRGEAVIVVNKHSPLRFLPSITGPELQEEVFVIYKDAYIERITGELISGENGNRIALTTNNLEAIMQMVIRGNAITIGTDYIVNALPERYRNELVAIPIDKYRKSPNYLWRVTKKDVEVSAVIKEFTQQLFANLE